MTVNELIQKLVELAMDGKGQYEVWMCESLNTPVSQIEIQPYWADDKEMIELQ